MGQKANSCPAVILAAQGMADPESELGRRLEKHGLEVIEITTGENPLETARNLMPDLILLGFPADKERFFGECRRFSSDAEVGRIPILVRAGELGLKEKSQGYEAGIREFVSEDWSP